MYVEKSFKIIKHIYLYFLEHFSRLAKKFSQHNYIPATSYKIVYETRDCLSFIITKLQYTYYTHDLKSTQIISIVSISQNGF
jgi:hypothetical protein